MRNAQGTPAIIAGDSQAIFERVFLGKGVFSENWLQQLINDHPSILPLAEIEPGFGIPVAAAMEVSTAHGYIDNLFLTPCGEIVLVEAKLWSNVESRRKVVAQALDYVAALTGQDYSSFERMVMAARGSTGLQTLHGLVAEHADALGEPAFIDAVSRNLQHGRMVVIVLGDGIRSEARALAQLLQSHAGAHFTFALVELAIWKNPLSGDLLAIPNTLAQTVMIERGIVRIEGGIPVVSAVPAGTYSQTPKSITTEMFDEALAKRDPALPDRLHKFAASLEPLGVYVEQRASLNLKVDVGGSAPVNLGYIDKGGKLWVWMSSKSVKFEFANQYIERLAELIGGKVMLKPDPCLTSNGAAAPFIDALLPAHADTWRAAIKELIAAARADTDQGLS